ncbi:MAG: ABC transporter permease [Atribacterota bacterium]|jgi:peptide/nickel transport system permease protein|nr:ABC transporter permease [Atribacterota bacterium]
MKWYLTKRLLMLIPVLLGASILVFSLIHLAPGDPARTIAGEHASIQTIERIQEKYGLNKPLPTQYWIWLKQALQGDFGRSIVSNEFVSREIWDRFPNTVELTVLAMFIAVAVGVFAGIISASRQYSFLDYSVMGVALFGVSMPVFWLGIMLMMIFGVYLRWLPIGGRISIMVPFTRITGFYLLDSIIAGNWAAFSSSLRHLILPAVALGTIPMATIARVTRSSMLEVLRQDYIRTERAKGLSERLVIYKHAVRNALIPVVTVIGLNFGLLLAGAILTETVFSWPGLGRYVVKAVQMRDYPAVQGCVLFFAFIFVIVNLITDLIYVYIDPRIKYQ